MTLTFNLPEQMLQMAQQLCQIILKSMHKCRSFCPHKAGQMAHAHTWNKNCNNYRYVLLTASGLDKNSTMCMLPTTLNRNMYQKQTHTHTLKDQNRNLLERKYIVSTLNIVMHTGNSHPKIQSFTAQNIVAQTVN